MRPLGITIYNSTRYTATFDGIQFDSGRLRSNSSNVIEPGQVVTITLANRDGSVFCGVSGEMYWKLSNGLHYAIGFSHPYSGGYKGLVLTKNGQFNKNSWKAYYAMTDNCPQHNNQVSTQWNVNQEIPSYTVIIRE